MKRMTSMCLAALLSGAAAVGAQTAQSQGSRPNGSVTMVGCLEQGKEGPEYFLSGATEQRPERPVGTSGSATAAKGERLRLVSSRGYDLGDAVNQRIEVSGEMTGRGKVRTLSVMNVRSIAPTCTAPGSVK